MKDSISKLEAENHEEIVDNVILRRYIRRFTTSLSDKNKKDEKIMQQEKMDLVMIGMISHHMQFCKESECPCQNEENLLEETKSINCSAKLFEYYSNKNDKEKNEK